MRRALALAVLAAVAAALPLDPPRLEGTFTIVGGTGAFVGAPGSGIVWAVGTGVRVPSATAHYRGTITLP